MATLAMPVVVAEIGWVAMGLVDTLMVGLQLALLLYGLSALPRRARTPRGLDLQPADMR